MSPLIPLRHQRSGPNVGILEGRPLWVPRTTPKRDTANPRTAASRTL